MASQFLSVKKGSNLLFVSSSDASVKGHEGKVTSVAPTEVASLADASFEGVGAVGGLSVSSDLAAHFFRILSPGGVVELIGADAAVSKSLLFSGFEVFSTEDDRITAKKPEFSMKSVSLNAAWTLGGDALMDDDLIDEDALLEDEFQPVTIATPSATDDCELGAGGGRKACKDCTCGRAEGLLAPDAPAQPSSCGSCGLGDGFRCASCPYAGLPPFKSGEEPVVTTTASGAVKLDLS